MKKKIEKNNHGPRGAATSIVVRSTMEVKEICRELTIDQVLHYFQKYKDLGPTLPPLKPKGGDCFMFMPADEDCKGIS